jgi:hypothetical protein
MQYGPHRRHSTWTIGLKRIKDFDATSFCKLLKAAALTLSADFGFIHSNTAGDISRGLRNGSVTFLDVHRGKKNLFVTTHTLKKYVPDIYWMTFFGARYVQLFSRESLISAAAYRIEELDNGGIVVQLTPELTDVAADEVAFERIRRDVRIHLDSNAIYDTDKGVDHHYQVPEFAWGPVLH